MEIGIADLDEFFSKCQTPLDTLCDISEKIDQATQALLDLDQVQDNVVEIVTTEQKENSTLKEKLKKIIDEAAKTGTNFTLSISSGKPEIVLSVRITSILL